MFKRTKFYSVYVPKGTTKPLEDAVLVQEGFNIWAFVFNMFWAMFHKAWIEAGVIFLILGIIAVVNLNYGIELGLLRLAVQVIVGFEAAEIQANSLKRRGYLLYSVVAARDESEAFKRYVETEA